MARHLEERLTVSQSVSQSGKQSVSQSVAQAGKQIGRQKHTVWLFFFSRRLRLQTVENPNFTGAVGDRVEEHSLFNSHVVGSNPSWRWLSQVHRFFFGRPWFKSFSALPPPKFDIQFQGERGLESKNPVGGRRVGQNNDFTRG